MNYGRNRFKSWKQLQLFAAALLCTGLNHAAFAQEIAASSKPPIILESTGAYEVGGKVITNPNNPNQTLSCDHGYVEYFIPAKRRSVGLIMWHSSSTKVWENRWDGGEGYKSIFLRRGYPVYLWDGPRVGRANWSCEPITYTPEYFDQRNFVAWRFGSAYPKWVPGLQFPTDNAEAWNQATRARYDEFDTPRECLAAGRSRWPGHRQDRTCRCSHQFRRWLARDVVSPQGNKRQHEGYRCLRNPGFVFPEGEGPEPKPKAPFGPHSVPLAEFMKLTKFPIQLVFGDNISVGNAIWPAVGRTRRGRSATSSIVTAEIARSCCFRMRVCTAIRISPLPISITKPLRTNCPNGCIAKASTSLPENRQRCGRWLRREASLQ